MNQTLIVGMLETVGRLGDIISHERVRQWAMLFDEYLQIDPFDVLHHDVMGIFFVVDIVGSNDIGMTQRCNRFCLTLKPLKIGGLT